MHIANKEYTLTEFYDSTKVFLEVRDESHLMPHEIAFLSLSDLKDFGCFESWTCYGTNNQLSYASHGVFRYFGKFPPPIATHLIRKYTSDRQMVVDLMSGSGTTGVEALIEHRNCILNDINPLSELLAIVKTTHIPKEHLLETRQHFINHFRQITFDEYPFLPTGLKNYEHWFLPETVDSLRGIKYLIQQESSPEIKNFLNVCLAATIRRVSRATSQQGRLFLDVESAVKDAFPFFLKRFDIGVNGVTSIPSRDDLTINSTRYDLKIPLPDYLKEIADLIILHPPYFNAYKYSSVNSLELSWLGFDHNQIRKSEVREFFKVGKEENSQKYVDDMVQVMKNSASALKTGGRLALMIGDTIIHGNYIPITKMLLNAIGSEIFDVELIALRTPKYTEASWAASQRRNSEKVGITLYDYIVVMRKK